MQKRIYLQDTHSTIYYLPHSGRFYRIDRYSGKARRTGVSKNGPYRTISFRGKTVYSHRLAFFAVTGRWPKPGCHIDHVNGRQKANNAFINLREATPQQNGFNRVGANRNSTTKVRGVSKNKNGTYRAYIHVGGVQKHLGTYPTKDEARHRVERAAAVEHGIFNHMGIKAVQAA